MGPVTISGYVQADARAVAGDEVEEARRRERRKGRVRAARHLTRALDGLTFGIRGATGEQPDGRRRRAGFDVAVDRPAFKIALERLHERYEGQSDRDGYDALAVYRLRPPAPTPHFQMAEFALRIAAFDDPDAARPATPTSAAVPAARREVQVGGNYYVNSNLRLQANAIVPVDERESPDATLVARLQLMF